jgi:hypothetical protein
MQFSYAVSAAPPPPTSQQYKKAATVTTTNRTLQDAAPRKPDAFAEVCRLMLSETSEMHLRAYEHMPYED